MSEGLRRTLTNRAFLKLVPRLEKQGYSEAAMSERRQWVEDITQSKLETVAKCAIPSETMRGNIENPIGSVQMPLGIAGPLTVNGQYATGTYYVPMATTEGALLRSYERGSVVITRSGGADVRIFRDENYVAPTFRFADHVQACTFIDRLPELREGIKQAAESTTRHGKLIRVEPFPMGRDVVVQFGYDTGDAHGMNMIVKATEAACRHLVEQGEIPEYQLFSGMSMEKRQGGMLMAGGKGKKVTAGVLIPAKLAKAYLHATPKQIHDLWQQTAMGQAHAAVLGVNGHLANGLTALFIATGQDVANVVNSAAGITKFSLTDNGDLYASLTLPSLTLATVGGGTALGTSAECLAMIDCLGSGKARKFAEITAAVLLAGELSFAAAIAGGEFVDAHETYGRNRPEQDTHG